MGHTVSEHTQQIDLMKDDIFLDTKVQILTGLHMDLVTQKRICYFPIIRSSKGISDATALLNSLCLDAQIF